MLEMLIIVSLIAFVVVAGVRRYGNSVNDKFAGQSAEVASMNGDGVTAAASHTGGTAAPPSRATSVARSGATANDDLVIEFADESPRSVGDHARSAAATTKPRATATKASAAKASGAAQPPNTRESPLPPTLPWVLAAVLLGALAYRYAKRHREHRKQKLQKQEQDHEERQARPWDIPSATFTARR